MNYRKNTKRKGFTLVELLIVIVVIGILSAMMMLSSTEAVSSAKASNIISNLRNLKTAALAWYADNPDYVENTIAKDANKQQLHFADDKDGRKGIISYLGNTGGEVKNISGNGNTFVLGGFQYITVVEPHQNQNSEKLAGAKWYISCNVDEKNSTKNIRVREKLAGRAKSVGLLSGRTKDDTEAAPYDGATGDYPGTVYYRIH